MVWKANWFGWGTVVRAGEVRSRVGNADGARGGSRKGERRVLVCDVKRACVLCGCRLIHHRGGDGSCGEERERERWGGSPPENVLADESGVWGEERDQQGRGRGENGGVDGMGILDIS